MKKIFTVAACLLCSMFLFAGCPEQTFDDIAYNTSETTALSLIQDINSSRARTASLNAEYETTDITQTDSGTTEIITNLKYGRFAGTLFTQKTTSVKQNSQLISTQTLTYYNGKIYQTTDGIVSQAGTYTTLNTLNFFDSFITRLTENDVLKIKLIEEKKFKNTTYYRLNMYIHHMNIEFPQPATEYITSYSLEYGINSSGYIEMFRINTIIKTDIASETATDNNADYWKTSSNRKCTTLLLHIGDRVQFTPPVIA